jgi:hypothetical protein
MVLPSDALKDLLKKLEDDGINLKEQLIDICIFMKGGISWDEAWGLSYLDRELIVKRLNKRLKEQSGDKTEYM